MCSVPSILTKEGCLCALVILKLFNVLNELMCLAFNGFEARFCPFERVETVIGLSSFQPEMAFWS